jgi:hypothetical protein
VNVSRLARGQPLDGLVDAVDQPALAHLVGEAGGRGLLDGLAVDGGRQVDQDEVVLRGRAVDAGQRAEPGAQVLQLLVDCSSVTSTSSTETEMVPRSGSVISGRTSTSAWKASFSPSAISVTSMSGRPIGVRSSAAVMARCTWPERRR